MNTRPSFWRLLALLVVLAMTAAACGSDSEGASDAGPDTSSEDTSSSTEATEPDTTEDTTAAEDMEEVTIRFTWWGNPERDEKTIAMVDLFMEEYPNITVETEPTVFDGYFDKLTVGIAGGDAPDVVTLGGTWPLELGAAGALVDLSQLPESGIDQFDPNSYALSTLDGAVYGLPTGGNARGVLINEALFEAAGIEIPDGDSWTWEEFIALAGELTAASGGEFVGTDWRVQEMKEEFVAQRGTEMFLADGTLGADEAIMTELFSIPLQLVDNGGMPSAELTTELAGTTMEQTLLGQGGAAMMFAYSNNVQAFADVLGTPVSMIKLPGESQYSGPGTSVLPSQFFSVSSGSEHPEAAGLLVDWLLNEPSAAAIILANRGLSFNPAILDAISPELAEYERQSASFLSTIATEGRATLPLPAGGKGEIDDLTLRLESEVLFGRATPAEAAAEWVEESTIILAEAQEG